MTRLRSIESRSILASSRLCRSVAAASVISISAALLVSCNNAPQQTPTRSHIPTQAESRAESAMQEARHYGEPELYAFLKSFPKGADLHMHLSGAVYAETFITEAVRQGLCIVQTDPGKPASPADRDTVRFAAPPCSHGAVPASEALANQQLYDNLVDSFSMRAFVPSAGIDGHDQFFATFARFGGLKDATGEWLDEVATRAASQNEQYLEIMETPAFSNAIKLGNQVGWPSGSEQSVTPQTLSALRDKLLSAGLRTEVAVDEKELADGEAERRQREHCSAGSTSAANPACSIRIHFLYQVLRGFPMQQVFAQTLLAFEVASTDPDVVGINFVMPEDGRVSMHDYHLQMQMLDYLHSVYPHVHIALHAGELAPGMVPPEGLRFHIREALELGHAERIGHGVDVLYEDHPFQLLKEMAARHVDVEINLTSNDVILGIKGNQHPLSAYRQAHVPYSLSTDDEGVSRIDLTHEYVRAVEEQDLSYYDLKLSARNSLEHSFLHGESLWIWPDNYDHRKAPCAGNITATSNPSAECGRFLDANEKAAQQWELERRFAAFEASVRSHLFQP